MASFIGFSTSHKTSTSEKKLHCCNKLKTSPLVIIVGFSETIFKQKQCQIYIYQAKKFVKHVKNIYPFQTIF